ncbi:hypothetical protein OROMI_021019 [Orobanche minor]
MADITLIGSATTISHSFGNPHQNSPVICEIAAPKKPSVESTIHKNVAGSVSTVHNTQKNVVAGETLLGKTQSVISDIPSDPVLDGQTAQPSKNDADSPLPISISASSIEDSTKKAPLDTRSGGSSAPVLDVDLGYFIFPGAVIGASSNKSSGRVLSQGGSALDSSVPKVVLGDRPKIIGSNQTLEVLASENGISPQTEVDPVGLNLLKDPIIGATSLLVASKIPVVPSSVVKPGSSQNLVGLSSAAGVPSGSPIPGARVPSSVKPISVADLRGAVSLEVWARFPEAAVAQDPKAPTFAALVSKEPVVAERIGSTDFSGVLPTAVFTKEGCENVSAVYKNALIGKFSFGKPDNFAISNCLFLTLVLENGSL